MMMKIINAFPGMGEPMTEEETKNFIANYNNNLLIRLGIMDEKGEPNIVPLGYYFDYDSNRIYINTLKDTKKVDNLRKKNLIAYCIDDPTPPYKGVRGKATVKIHEDVNHNIPIAKKFIMKSIGSLDHPISKWLLTQVEDGNEVILEITPIYYSTWRSAIPKIE
jgi:Pyridoxamine 5'-phosphate oxidase